MGSHTRWPQRSFPTFIILRFCDNECRTRTSEVRGLRTSILLSPLQYSGKYFQSFVEAEGVYFGISFIVFLSQMKPLWPQKASRGCQTMKSYSVRNLLPSQVSCQICLKTIYQFLIQRKLLGLQWHWEIGISSPYYSQSLIQVKVIKVSFPVSY